MEDFLEGQISLIREESTTQQRWVNLKISNTRRVHYATEVTWVCSTYYWLYTQAYCSVCREVTWLCSTVSVHIIFARCFTVFGLGCLTKQFLFLSTQVRLRCAQQFLFLLHPDRHSTAKRTDSWWARSDQKGSPMSPGVSRRAAYCREQVLTSRLSPRAIKGDTIYFRCKVSYSFSA